ncbi:MAG: hypothetical protein KVP17_000100 [Porospora cf. gigantea B]|nr:MAG: hypothetical protein KVP17_000100 [Porospora cf. gigantea B]
MPSEQTQEQQPCEEELQPYEEEQQPCEEELQPFEEEQQPCEEEQQPCEEEQQPYEEEQQPCEEELQPYSEEQPYEEEQQSCEAVREDEPEQPNEGDGKYDEVPYRGDPGVEFTHETVLRQPGTAASRARSLGPRERIPLVRGKVDAIRNMFELEPSALSPTSEPSQGADRLDVGEAGPGNALEADSAVVDPHHRPGALSPTSELSQGTDRLDVGEVGSGNAPLMMPLSHLSEHVEADSAVVDPHHRPGAFELSQAADRLDVGEVGSGNAALMMPVSHLSEHVEADSAEVDPHHGPVLVIDPQQHYYFHGDEDLDETECHLQPVGLESSLCDPLYLDTGDDDSVSAVLKTPEEHFPDRTHTALRASDAPESDRHVLSIRSSPFVETFGPEPISADPIDAVAVDAPDVSHQLFMPADPVQPISSSGTLQYSPTSDRDLAVSPSLLPKVRQRGAGQLDNESKGLLGNEASSPQRRLSSAVSWPQVPYGAGMIPRQEATPPAKPRYRKSVHELGGHQIPQLPHGEQPVRRARVDEGEAVPRREQTSVRRPQNLKTTGPPAQKDRGEPHATDASKRVAARDKNAARNERLPNPTVDPISCRGRSVERSVQTELTAEDLQALRSHPTAREPERDFATRFAPRGDILFEDAQGNQAVADSGARSAVSISDLLEQALNTKNPEVVNLKASFARRSSPEAARSVPPIRRESPRPTRHRDVVVKQARPPQAMPGKGNISDEESVRLRHTTQPNLPIFRRPSDVRRHHAPQPSPRHISQGPSLRHTLQDLLTQSPSPRHASQEHPSPRHASQEHPSPRHASQEPPAPRHASQEPPAPRHASLEPPSPRHASLEPPSPRHASLEPPSPRHASQEPPSPRHASQEPPAPRHASLEPPSPRHPSQELPSSRHATAPRHDCVEPPPLVEPFPGQDHRRPVYERHSREGPEHHARRKSPGAKPEGRYTSTGRPYRPSFETFSPRGIVRRNGNVEFEDAEGKRKRKLERAHIRADRDSRRQDRNRPPRVDIVVARVRREP